MKTTKLNAGIYKAEYNNQVFKISKSQFSNEWEIYRITINGYGAENDEWETTQDSKKDCIEYIKDRF